MDIQTREQPKRGAKRPAEAERETREAAEAKWTEWVQRHDADSDGKLSYKEIAAGITHQPRKPAYMEAVKKTVKDFPFLELAGGAFAIASKVSKEVYEVDTLYGILMRGEAKIGASDRTRELLLSWLLVNDGSRSVQPGGLRGGGLRGPRR